MRSRYRWQVDALRLLDALEAKNAEVERLREAIREMFTALTETDSAQADEAVTWWTDDFGTYVTYPGGSDPQIPEPDPTRPSAPARRYGESLGLLMELSGWEWPAETEAR